VKLPEPTAVPDRAEEIAMKRLSVYRIGLLLGLTGTSMSAEAGVLGPTSAGSVSISVTIAPHVVVSEASRPAQVMVGDPAEAFCIGSRGLTAYRATLLASIGGRSEAIDLPLVRKLPSDQHICGQEAGEGAAVHLDGRMVQAIRGSAEPATLLIIPD
jgi:hypothetical protein